MGRKVLLVIAHPKEKSLNKFLAKQYQELCLDAGHEVKIIDLYKDKFNPVYHSHLDNDPLIKVYQDLVLWSDHLVFFYPVWWSDMPAILKGFFDKIFARKFAFEFKSGGSYVGLLQSRSAQMIRTHGGPKIFSWFVGYANYAGVKWGIFKFCGLKFKGSYDLYSVDTKKMSEAKARAFVDTELRKAIKKI